MKKLCAYILILVFSVVAHAAPDQKQICKNAAKSSAPYAEWALQQREQMLANCGKVPTKSCQRKYTKEIERQYEIDRRIFVSDFAAYSDSDDVFRAHLAVLHYKAFATLIAFQTGNSLKEVLSDTESMCLATPLNALQSPRPAPRRNVAPPPLPPPIIPMAPAMQIPQAGINAAPDMGGCTNYTLMGADGRAQYCQKCCYAGNCNVFCN